MIRAILIGLGLLLFGAGTAFAGTSPSCTPTSAGISFGNFTGSQITITGSITLTCTGTGSDNYNLDLSTGSSGSYTPRRMKNGSNSLSYNLYTDPTFSKIWGAGSGGVDHVSGTVNMGSSTTVTITIPLYAKLPAQTKPPFGPYSDTIVATLTISNVVTTVSFLVTANVPPDCTFSAADLVFGTYSGAQLDAQSQISLTCTSGTAWNVGLNQGTFAGATVTTRKMTGPGSSSMSYSLFRNSARSQNWGNTVGTDTVSGTGSGSSQSVTVFGRVPGAQNLPAGSYQDTIIATITF
jgi:spore coat protein U-like protein